MVELSHLHYQTLDRIARVNLVSDQPFMSRGAAFESLFSDLAQLRWILVLIEGESCVLTGLGAQKLRAAYEDRTMLGYGISLEGYTLDNLTTYAQRWAVLKASLLAQVKEIEE